MNRNSNRVRISGFVLTVTVLVAFNWANAGSLTPPAGPIAPTQRTHVGDSTTPGDAFSVFRIVQPGSYYLTSNVKGVAGKHGIEIDASGVTLDLMGFEVGGVVGSQAGIHVTNPVTNLAIVNGSVRNWGQDGVILNASNSRMTDLRVSGNGGYGIISGGTTVVTGCVTYQNTGSGISLSTSSVVNDCISRENLGRGVTTGSGSVITNTVVSTNGQEGIYVTGGCTISNCTAIGNWMTGIFVGSGGKVTDCSATFNRIDGMWIGSNSLVRGNTSYSNGDFGDGAGILVTGADNRIERNNCTDNDRGIDVDVAGNFITGNVCSANTTNWDVAAGNVCLVVNATTSAAILGNGGGVAPGSTDPNANFTY